MIVSQHVGEGTHTKAICVLLFLRFMYNRDNEYDDDVASIAHAQESATHACKCVGMSKTFVYRCYMEWRTGQEWLAFEDEKKGVKLTSNSFLKCISVDPTREGF